jgi:Domain of unknown function (DUF4111)
MGVTTVSPAVTSGASSSRSPVLSSTQSEQLFAVVDLLRRSIGADLYGVYLHGSASSSGLRPESDLDVLAVTGRSLKDDQRCMLLDGLLHLSPPIPGVPEGPRRLEVIVIVAGPNGVVSDPTQTNFLFGEWLRNDFSRGILPMPHNSADMILLLAQARETAFPIFGDSLSMHLPAIPPESIREALHETAPQLMSGLVGDERNALLTLARMWWTAATGTFVSKDLAAAWAMARLTDEAREMLELAMGAYLGQVRDHWESRRQAARQTAEVMQYKTAGCLMEPPAEGE